MCFVRGLTVKQTAAVIGIAVPTLREHYSSELAMRKLAVLKMEMRQLERLNAAAEQGNVGAEKALGTMLDKLRTRDLAERLPAQRTAKAKPKGKKEEQQAAAKGIGGRFGTREPPPGLRLN